MVSFFVAPAAPDSGGPSDDEILLGYARQGEHGKPLVELRDPVKTPMVLKEGWFALANAVPYAVRLFDAGHPELLKWLREVSRKYKERPAKSRKGAKKVSAAGGGGGGGGAGESSEGGGGGGSGDAQASAPAEEESGADQKHAHLQGFKKAMQKLEIALKNAPTT